MKTWCLFDSYLISYEPMSTQFNQHWDILRASCPGTPRLTGTVVIHRKGNYVGMWELIHDIPRLLQARYGDRDKLAYMKFKKASERGRVQTEALTKTATPPRPHESKVAK